MLLWRHHFELWNMRALRSPLQLQECLCINQLNFQICTYNMLIFGRHTSKLLFFACQNFEAYLYSFSCVSNDWNLKKIAKFTHSSQCTRGVQEVSANSRAMEALVNLFVPLFLVMSYTVCRMKPASSYASFHTYSQK